MMRARAMRRRGGGYLLIEALIALALAATVATSLLALHIELRRQGGLAAQHAAATRLGEAHIEWLTGALRAHVEPETGPGEGPAVPRPGGPQPEVRWTVAPGPGDTTALAVTVRRPHAADEEADRTFAGLVERGAAADSGWGAQGSGGATDGGPG